MLPRAQNRAWRCQGFGERTLKTLKPSTEAVCCPGARNRAELKKRLAEKPGRTAKEVKLQEEMASELRRLKTHLTEVRCPVVAGVRFRVATRVATRRPSCRRRWRARLRRLITHLTEVRCPAVAGVRF